MGNDNKKGKLRGKKFVWFERMLRREGRKLCAVALCASMIIGNMAWPAAAASDTSGEYSFELSRASLYDALQAAVSEGETVETDLEFMGEWAEDYAELLEADGSLYELSPTIKNKDEDRDKVLDLRVFARIENDIEFDSAYEIDGSEEIIFLLVNSSEVYQKAVIAVDERESDTITVLPASAVEVNTEEAVTVDTVNPVTTTTTTSGGGGGGSHSTNDIVIDNTDESAAAEYKDSEVELLNDKDQTGTTGTELNETEAENETEVQEEDDIEEQLDETSGESTDPSSEDTRDSDTDTEEKKDEADGTGTDTENGSGNAASGNSGDSGTQSGEGTGTGDTGNENTSKDETGDSGSGNTGAESSGNSGEGNTGDSGDTGNTGETGTDTGSGSGSKEDTAGDTTSDTGNTETDGLGDTDNSGDGWGDSNVTVSSAISVHPTWRLTATATASDAEQDVASPSDADDYLAGTIYETVRLDEDGVVAFVTTAGDMELDDEIFTVASASDATKLSAKTENVSVVVSADEGVLPEGTELVVTELNEDNDDTADQYQEAANALTDGGVEYDEMLALDISLIDDNGDEIEPEDGEVEVTISLNADILPEDIEAEALAVQHLVESDDGTIEVNTVADSTDDTDGSMGVSDTAVLTSFSVESFSTFAITWTQNGDTVAKVTVHYVDSTRGEIDGSQIQTDNISISSGNTVDLSGYAGNISGYEYIGAYYDYLGDNQTELTTLTASRTNRSNTLSLDNTGKSFTSRTTIEVEVYLVYKDTEPMRTFQGLNTEGIIDINLYNLDATSSVNEYSSEYPFQFHSSDTYNGWTGKDNGVRQGLVNNKLGSNGYPELKTGYINNLSSENNIGVLFDGKTARGITYLLQKDEDGYYYYDSGENFATLDSDGNFALYEDPRGWSLDPDYPLFLPFNTLTNNLQTDNGHEYYPLGLTSFAENVNTDTELRTHNADYYMGMEVGFDFIMPQKGMLDESSDMVFEFEGDDDVWVFIDDVLVLDMGGVHDNYGGSINFATGDVKVDKVYNSSDDGIAGTNTTISEMFQKASSVWDSTAYKTHTFKMFYFERGAGGSNCKMKFNMPIIPEGTINFEKELGYSNDYDTADFGFNFVTYVNYDGEGDDYELYKGDYKIYTDSSLQTLVTDDNHQGGIWTTGDDGVITLTDGQVAQLLGSDEKPILATSTFYIQELGATSDKYNVTSTSTKMTTIFEDDQVTEVGVQTDMLTVGDKPYVVFANTVVVDNQYNLKIEKQVEGTVDEDDTYQVKLLLGETSQTPYVGPYKLYDDNGSQVTEESDNGYFFPTSEGIITLKKGQYVIITGLIGGNTVRVEEVTDSLSDNYGTPGYSMTGTLKEGTAVSDSFGITGVVKEGTDLSDARDTSLDADVTVVVTNRTKPNLTIVKEVEGNMGERNRDFSFTVTITDSNGSALTETFTGFTQNSDGTYTCTLQSGQSLTLKDLPVGAIVTIVEEDCSEDGYSTSVSVDENGIKNTSQAERTYFTGSESGLTKDTTVTFTNSRRAKSPTGIFTEHLPYALMVIAALLGGVWLVNDRRKKIYVDRGQ